MAGAIEAEIITRIETLFSEKYTVSTSSGKQETGSPRNAEKVLYRPDVILRDKKSDRVKYIIEIETDPVRKALVGACILADHCMGIEQPGEKPKLLFIIGNRFTDSGIKGIRQLSHFQIRGKVAEKYMKNIQLPIIIDTQEKIVTKIR